MRVFITGATGFIGKHLIKRLKQTGHQLNCLVRKQSAVDELKVPNVTLVPGDVTDKDSIIKAMTGCDSVINLANVYSFWEPDKRIYSRINIDGTRNVMEAVLKTGISKVIHISSVVVYGKPAEIPFNEESAPGPFKYSEYARTKYEGDLIAWKMFEKEKLPLVVIYPAAVMGPGDTKTTGAYVKAIVNRKMPAIALPDSVLTFVHVGDVAEAIVRALEKPNNIGEKYLIGKYQLSMGEINEMIREISGVRLPRLRLPDFMVTLNAYLLTLIADIIKKPPLWGLSVDQIKTMKAGFRCDGSKAERELGLAYTPIRTALEGMLSA